MKTNFSMDDIKKALKEKQDDLNAIDDHRAMSIFLFKANEEDEKETDQEKKLHPTSSRESLRLPTSTLKVWLQRPEKRRKSSIEQTRLVHHFLAGIRKWFQLYKI